MPCVRTCESLKAGLQVQLFATLNVDVLFAFKKGILIDAISIYTLNFWENSHEIFPD